MLPFDFTASLAFDGTLVPSPDHWPVFDEVLMCAFSPQSSSSSSSSPSLESDPLPPTFPSSAVLAAMPTPPSRSPPRNKNPDHIPRPRNAFMLFRSAFAAAQKISANIEHDNRHITRIIAHCWNRLSDAEKQVWRDKAAAEKAQHAERYPNYRFSPVGRANKPVKRNVRRNGAEDVKRCEKLAELVMAGKYGQELESAVKKFDHEHHSTENPADVFTSAEKHKTRLGQDSEPSDVPPFRSPLLPPTKTTSQQVSDEHLMFDPPVQITTPHHVEPQTFCSLANASASDDLSSLWGPPCHQYYQPNTRDGTSSPPSIPPLDHSQVMRFVQSSHGLAQPEQSVSDFSLFSWSQSDSFSYYH